MVALAMVVGTIGMWHAYFSLGAISDAPFIASEMQDSMAISFFSLLFLCTFGLIGMLGIRTYNKSVEEEMTRFERDVRKEKVQQRLNGKDLFED